jgi:hypothetical protein
MNKIVFLDTETTSLRPDRRAWEIAVIVREPQTVTHPDGPDTTGTRDAEHRWLVDAEDLDLGNADLMSLKIGRFYERHPQARMYASNRTAGVRREAVALAEVEQVTRGAHLVGAVPSFDAEVLSARMRAHGICPSWHYHLQDTETLIIGYLRGQGQPVPDLPWRSDDLSRLIGVEPPGEDSRHTALGDADWCRRIWDAVMS